MRLRYHGNHHTRPCYVHQLHVLLSIRLCDAQQSKRKFAKLLVDDPSINGSVIDSVVSNIP